MLNPFIIFSGADVKDQFGICQKNVAVFKRFFSRTTYTSIPQFGILLWTAVKAPETSFMLVQDKSGFFKLSESFLSFYLTSNFLLTTVFVHKLRQK
jgi:hypothetical protein